MQPACFFFGKLTQNRNPCKPILYRARSKNSAGKIILVTTMKRKTRYICIQIGNIARLLLNSQQIYLTKFRTKHWK